jgi:hypothetical protein
VSLYRDAEYLGLQKCPYPFELRKVLASWIVKNEPVLYRPSGRRQAVVMGLALEPPSILVAPKTSLTWDDVYRWAGGMESVTALSLSMATFWLAVSPFAVARSVWGVS